MKRLSDIGTIRDILSRHGFTFSKALGQNFLVNPSVCPRMAEASGAGQGVGVLEIGPGIGVLTGELCQLADKVVAIELDKRLLPVLDETLAEFDNVKIVNGDVLELDLNRLIGEEFEGLQVVVCANLPYYITSPVLLRLLESDLPIAAITVMVQKEVAQRLCAKPGTKTAGALTVMADYYAEARRLFDVSKGSFYPAPQVDSAVIQLMMRPAPAVAVDSSERFFRLVKAAFSQKRKTLVNAVSSTLHLSKQTVLDALQGSGLPEAVRAEALTTAQFGELYHALQARGALIA